MSGNVTPPNDYPSSHLLAGDVPAGFHEVLAERVRKNGGLHFDHLVQLAIVGAECERTHALKAKNPRRRS